MALLEVDKIECSYGRIRALEGISLKVEDGEIVTLIGANGAGKTTTLRAISGLVRPGKGSIRFDGKDLLRLTPDQIVKLGLGHSPEGRRVFSRMTVRENLELGAFIRKSAAEIKSDLERVLTIFPRLKERLTQKAGTLSGGEQQMLAMARALMSRPRLLMLDEPSQGIMPKLVDEIFDAITEIRRNGMTVLIVEQRLTECLEIADRAYVLQTGRVMMAGSASEVRDNAGVRQAYLGL